MTRRIPDYFTICAVNKAGDDGDIFVAEISNGEEITFQAPARDLSERQLMDGQPVEDYTDPVTGDLVGIIDNELIGVFTGSEDGNIRTFKRPAVELAL